MATLFAPPPPPPPSSSPSSSPSPSPAPIRHPPASSPRHGLPSSFPLRPTDGSSRPPSHTPLPSAPATPGAPLAPSSTASTQPSSAASPSLPAHHSSYSRSRRHLGEYALGKTLGAGSMGKVKLAVSSVSGEKIAIKIIPRHTSLSAAQQLLAKDSLNHSPSGHPSQPPLLQPSPSLVDKAKAKDFSKEVRTIREASIVLLLHHPYVCGMKSMLVYPHHYYMLFEYVNGGQMLDYIISHGRLRERAARKFARQMGSALEYCHANSIVHRDLKIENILISKTGNIKIIDFGLSNLFSPNSNLQTFCGSLYFAAPELLNAKVYIGPEVDMWSFGIVLFVLVCGKVPFDDQSMPALHAKIKRGQVEYPTWLSSECKHILSRMLVTNPVHRATLHEVLNHTWMTKGYDGPPDPHIPHREPLRIEQIDLDVVRGMTGFEFGSADKILSDLRTVLSSEIYLKVLKLYDERITPNGFNTSLDPVHPSSSRGSNSSMPPLATPSKRDHHLKLDRDTPKSSSKSSGKRFSGLGFYSKKVAGGLAAVLNTVGGGGGGGAGKPDEREGGLDGNSPVISGFEPVLLNGQTLDSLDPTRGFHPLISIYFLVREKIEREKIYGPGVFASSTLSLTGPPPPISPPSAYKSALSPSRSAHAPDFTPTTTTTTSSTTTTRAHKASSTLLSSTTKTQTMAGMLNGRRWLPFEGRTQDHQPPVPINRPEPPAIGNSAQLLPTRPRTATGRMVSTPIASAPSSLAKHLNALPTPLDTHLKAPGQCGSSQRRSIHVMNYPKMANMMQGPNPKADPGSQRAGPALNGSATDHGGRSDRVVSMIEPAGATSLADMPSASLVKRFGSLLGRSSTVVEPDYKRHRPRSSIGGVGHKMSSKTPLSPLPQVSESSSASSPPQTSLGELQEQQHLASQGHTLAVTPENSSRDTSPMSAPVAGQMWHGGNGGKLKKLSHHQRGSSAGSGVMLESLARADGEAAQPALVMPHSASVGSSWRPIPASLNDDQLGSGGTEGPQNTLVESEEEEEETQAIENQIGSDIQPNQLEFAERTAIAPSPSRSSDKIKPIYLKGLFSVATTSTRGPKVLRDDLVKVLNRIGVQHREIKGGFECAHFPSIDLSSVGGPLSSQASYPGGSGNHTLKKKGATISMSPSQPSNQQPGQQGNASLVRNSPNTLKVKRSFARASITGQGDGKKPVVQGEDCPSDSSAGQVVNGGGEMEPGGSPGKVISPLNTSNLKQHSSGQGGGSGAAGLGVVNVNSVLNTRGSLGLSPSSQVVKKYDLIVRFEIFIVKMPLLPGICGLQFRRIAGNAWQYHTFARRILQELKL